MRRQGLLVRLCGLIILIAGAPCLGADATNDLPLNLPIGIGVEKQTPEMVFAAGDSRANFTFFDDGVKNVAVANGKLTFTLAREKATLGWGNYAGRQPVGAVCEMFQQENTVTLRLHQSAGPLHWQLIPWRDGKSLAKAREFRGRTIPTADTKGADWQELTFDPLAITVAIPDGLEFVVTGKPGTTVQIEWLKLTQRRFEGYVRYEFDLPAGDVWRADANVMSMNHRYWTGAEEVYSQLYINGREVERHGANMLYHLSPVDIKAYLKPGRNCVGFYGFRIGANQPPLMLDARIVMTDGRMVTVRTSRDWNASATAADGWSQPGFNDSDWGPPPGGVNPWLVFRDSSDRLGLPDELGPIVLSNPMGRWLTYNAADSLIVDVRVPGGLAARKPSVRWSLGIADAEGLVAPLDQGQMTDGRAADGSLTYQLDLGRRGDGVYALAVDLVGSDGQVIYQRSREPLVVLRRIEQKVVAADSYTAGMDLELETTIDFTNPKDPHPWHEFANQPGKPMARNVTEPTIVHDGELVYRQVGDMTYSSGFSYRVEFKHPGSLYLFELDYPDNGYRTIEACVTSKHDGVRFSTKGGVGAETGGRYHNTGKMETLRWVAVADSGPHSIDILNTRPVYDLPAAAAAFRVYRIKGDLPSAGAGNGRVYGIDTERQFYGNGFGRSFGLDRQMPWAERSAMDKELTLMQSFIKDMVWLKNAAEKYVQYLRFAGQNVQVIGCYQYHDYNTPYVPAADAADLVRVPWCPRTILAHIYALNDIDFYAGIEFSQFHDVRGSANDVMVARGADTINMVNADGEQRYTANRITIVPNWLHPLIRAGFADLIHQVADTFGDLPNFKGIHQKIGPSQEGSGYWLPGYIDGNKWDNPFDASFDDVTIGLFETDTGVQLPIDAKDPKRFTKRATLLATPTYRKQFLDWRCAKTAEFFKDALAVLRSQRADLQYINVIPLETHGFFEYLYNSHKSLTDILHDGAIDIGLLNALDGMSIGRWTVSWRMTGPPYWPQQDPYCWIARQDPDYVAAYNGARQRYIMCRTSWDENHPSSGGTQQIGEAYGSDWGELINGSDWIQNRAELTIEPQPSGDYARLAMIQAIITGDPNVLMSGFTDVMLNLGHEQAIRAITIPYTHLPPEKFDVVLDTGLDTNFAIRQLTRDGQSWFYVANPGYWPIEGTVTLDADAPVLEVVSGQQVAGSGHVELPIKLAPFGLAAFRVESGQLKISSYKATGLAPGDLDVMRGDVQRVRTLLSDPKTKDVLPAVEQSYMNEATATIGKTVADGQYARAWCLTTQVRYWVNWKQTLEKAARR